MSALKRSGDSKVTNHVHVTSGGKLTVKGRNAFGLPSGKGYSCPDATEFCSKVCYAGKLEKVRASVRAVLQHNWDLLRDATLAEAVQLLSDMIAEFVAECDKTSAPKLFRIHWDGDFFSPTYTAAWARVIKANPDVTFWAYTRVATAALFLKAQKLDNLSLYFSGDRDNLSVARHLETQGVNIAYVEESFDAGKAEFPKASRCPENNNPKGFPILNEKGSACFRCGLCINGRKSVLFSTNKGK